MQANDECIMEPANPVLDDGSRTVGQFSALPAAQTPAQWRILAIAGSLRASSSNALLLRATVALAREDVSVTIYPRLASLPHFNPDLDHEPAAPAVADFRSQLQQAHAYWF
jgi:hypothetical protein